MYQVAVKTGYFVNYSTSFELLTSSINVCKLELKTPSLKVRLSNEQEVLSYIIYDMNCLYQETICLLIKYSLSKFPYFLSRNLLLENNVRFLRCLIITE